MTKYVLCNEPVPLDILSDYVAQSKFFQDALAAYAQRTPDYWLVLDQLGRASTENLGRLYAAEAADGTLHAMLAYQIQAASNASYSMDRRRYIGSSLHVLRKAYGADTAVELHESHADDPTVIQVQQALWHGNLKMHEVYTEDTNRGFEQGSQELRAWLRNAVLLATWVSDADQADTYVYAMSRATMGEYGIDALIERINAYGPDKLEALRAFAGITSLASYSGEQLDRMYRLSRGEPDEIKRLQAHDVNAVLINRDGDHNGVTLAIAERVDDEAGRTLFFEIAQPSDVYGYLKRLSAIGIAPSTVMFASHGSSGQFFISMRPPIGVVEPIHHVTTLIDQELANTKSTNTVRVYDIAYANGMVRAVQRFMRPSRAIDDPESDEGRKKIVSLSCGFDAEAQAVGLDSAGEVVVHGETSLLQRLGEVLVARLKGEHIDIYGAAVSTNKQTKTPHGFHYNQLVDGRIRPYPASIVHIDDQAMSYGQVDEVLLRRAPAQDGVSQPGVENTVIITHL